MPEQQETLQELIERRRRELTPRGEKLLSNADLWRLGGREHWSKQVISNIVNGDVEEPGPKTVERLALALGVSENEIRAAAGVQRHGRPFDLPPRADALSNRERRIVLDVMDGLLGAYRPADLPASRRGNLQAVKRRDLMAERYTPPDARRRAAWTGDPGEKKDDGDPDEKKKDDDDDRS